MVHANPIPKRFPASIQFFAGTDSLNHILEVDFAKAYLRAPAGVFSVDLYIRILGECANRRGPDSGLKQHTAALIPYAAKSWTTVFQNDLKGRRPFPLRSESY